MAGIIELHSLGMDKEHLVGVVDRTKRIKDFKPLSGESIDLCFSVNRLGDLSNYLIEDDDSIIVDTHMIKRPLDLELFWKTLAIVQDNITSFTCSVECSESEARYGVNENFDVRLSFGVGAGGDLITIIIGSQSKGGTDLIYRHKLINRFIETIGLQEFLKAYINPKRKIEVTSLKDTIRDANNMVPVDYDSVLKQGVSLFCSGWTDSLGVGDLTIYLSQKRDMLVEASKRLMESGALGRPVAYKVGVGVNQEHYPAVKDTLNESPYGPWQVELTAKSKYTLKNLDKAVKETDYFSFRAFTFKPKGIGEVAAELTYRDGLFYLNFLWEVGENEKFKQLETLVTELLGGEEFLDPSEY